jgi:hypothetical protein
MAVERASEILQAHAAFWRAEAGSRALVGVTLSPYFPLQAFKITSKGLLRHEDVDVAPFLDQMDAEFEASQLLGGDAIWAAAPFYGIPWMEAILGCPIYVGEDTIWSKPPEWSWDQTAHLSPEPDNPWLQKLLEFTAALVERADGRYAVGLTLMRGPSDIIAALMGHERLCLELYDHPGEMKRLAWECAEIWVHIANAQLALIPKWQGGYCQPSRQVWALGPCLETQEDASIMLGPTAFRELLLPGIKHIASSFEYPIIHIHSGALRISEAVLEVDGLAAIEVTVDVAGPTLPELLPSLAKIQKAKPLIVHGTFDAVQMREALNSLRPEGLCLVSRVPSVKAGHQLLAAVRT